MLQDSAYDEGGVVAGRKKATDAGADSKLDP